MTDCQDSQGGQFACVKIERERERERERRKDYMIKESKDEGLCRIKVKRKEETFNSRIEIKKVRT